MTAHNVTGPRWLVYRVGADHFAYLILYPWGHGLVLEQGAGDVVDKETPTAIINSIRKQGNSVRWRASEGKVAFHAFNKNQHELGRELIKGSMNCEMIAP